MTWQINIKFKKPPSFNG